MKIKEAVWKECGECGKRREQVSEEVWGCDHCKKTINPFELKENARQYLDFSVFYKTKESVHHQVCSWACFAKLIKKIKTDHFISLPFMTFDGPNIKGIMAKDFLKILK